MGKTAIPNVIRFWSHAVEEWWRHCFSCHATWPDSGPAEHESGCLEAQFPEEGA